MAKANPNVAKLAALTKAKPSSRRIPKAPRGRFLMALNFASIMLGHGRFWSEEKRAEPISEEDSERIHNLALELDRVAELYEQTMRA